ncbi:unnamed protein product [Paramecium sonneborni]|uniref:Uncharacterized protein n=1 Tax=Paramecium sonneborni TaxID=65129 RepID=A0A8S1RRM6_9CILI|nr:unnamed protein product [Paramecium sonneborni]
MCINQPFISFQTNQFIRKSWKGNGQRLKDQSSLNRDKKKKFKMSSIHLEENLKFTIRRGEERIIFECISSQVKLHIKERTEKSCYLGLLFKSI